MKHVGKFLIISNFINATTMLGKSMNLNNLDKNKLEQYGKILKHIKYDGLKFPVSKKVIGGYQEKSYFEFEDDKIIFHYTCDNIPQEYLDICQSDNLKKYLDYKCSSKEFKDFDKMDITVTDIKEAEVVFELGNYDLDNEKEELINDLFENNKGFYILKNGYINRIEKCHKSFILEANENDGNLKFIIKPNEKYLNNKDRYKELYEVTIFKRELKDEQFYPEYKELLENFTYPHFDIKNITAEELIEILTKKLEKLLNSDIGSSFKFKIYNEKKEVVKENEVLKNGNYKIDSDRFYVKNSYIDIKNKFIKSVNEIITKAKNFDTLNKEDLNKLSEEITSFFKKYDKSNEKKDEYKNLKEVNDKFYSVYSKLKELNEFKILIDSKRCYFELLDIVDKIVHDLNNNSSVEISKYIKLPDFYKGSIKIDIGDIIKKIDPKNYIYKFKVFNYNYNFVEKGSYFEDVVIKKINSINNDYDDDLNKKLSDAVINYINNNYITININVDTTKINNKFEESPKLYEYEIAQFKDKTIKVNKDIKNNKKKYFCLFDEVFNFTEMYHLIYFDVFIDDKLITNISSKEFDVKNETIKIVAKNIICKISDDTLKISCHYLRILEILQKKEEFIKNEIKEIEKLNEDQVKNYKNKFDSDKLYSRFKKECEKIDNFKEYVLNAFKKDYVFDFYEIELKINDILIKFKKDKLSEEEKGNIEKIEKNLNNLVNDINNNISSIKDIEKLKNLKYSDIKYIKNELEEKLRSKIDNFDDIKSKIKDYDTYFDKYYNNISKHYSKKIKDLETQIKIEQEEKNKKDKEKDKENKEEEDPKEEIENGEENKENDEGEKPNITQEEQTSLDIDKKPKCCTCCTKCGKKNE